MRIENPSWGQQSQPTIWDQQPTWLAAPVVASVKEAGDTAPVVASVEYTGDKVLAGSLVGEIGHLAVFEGSELGGDDYAIKGID